MGTIWVFVISWLAKKGLDKVYQNTVDWFKKPASRGVLILGPGGVGKTTLGRILSGEWDKYGTTAYEESISTEQYSIPGGTKVQIIVPPGQSHRRNATWDTLLAELSDGKFRGVVFICAYGNHSLGDLRYENHKHYNPEAGFDAFVAKYLEECRRTEEQILKIVCDAVKKCSKPIWILTLVTKQDLWWDDRAEVERYYSEGRFKKIVNDCLGGKGADIFRHEIAYASLTIRNLSTGHDEVLRKTVSGYDMPLHEKSFEKLLQVFDGLMKWEEQHAK